MQSALQKLWVKTALMAVFLFLAWTPGKSTAAQLPDSLLNKLSRSPDYRSKVSFLFERISKYEVSAPQLALQCAERALSLAKEKRDRISEAKSLYWLSYIRVNQIPYSEDLELSLSNALVAARIFQDAANILWLCRTYEQIAVIYFYQDKQEEAQSYINQSLTLIQQSKEKDRQEFQSLLASALNTKASIIQYAAPDSTLLLLDQSLRIYENWKDSIGIARILLNKGTLYGLKGGVSYYQKAIHIYEQLDAPLPLIRAYLRYGTFNVNSYVKTRDSSWIAEGLSYLKKAMDRSDHLDNCEIWSRMGHAFRVKSGIGGIDSALDSAGHYFQQAIVRSGKEGNYRCLEDLFREVAKTCEALNNCADVLPEIRKAFDAILGLREKNTTEARKKLALFEAEEKAKKERRSRAMLLYGGLALLLVASSLFFIFYQRQRIKNLENKMQALGAQMNPHFISNSLNAIDFLINFGSREEASRYLIEFSRLSRMVLENAKAPLISLAEELETLRYFLNLEQLRLKDVLTYSIEIGPKLSLDEIMIPPMMIQPFAENAVWHGIQKKQAPGHLLIRIMEKSKTHIVCIIQDDGIGRANAKALQKASVLNHTSRSTTIAEERIDLINRIKGTSLKIEDLYSDAGLAIGTKVVISLPKIPVFL